jgi:hypothetical protein
MLACTAPSRARPIRSSRRHPFGALASLATILLGCATAGSVSLAAGVVLRGAIVDVAFQKPTGCQVQATFTIDTPAPADIEHRIMAIEGTTISVIGTSGASLASPVAVRGRTQSLVIRLPGAGPQTYTVEYQVAQPATQSYRCPLWVPTVPTDGRSRGIEIRVGIPEGGSARAGTLPAFAWTGSRGSSTLGHLPSVVWVPYRVLGQPVNAPGLDIAQAMDVLAVAILVAGTAIFAWRKKGR